MSHNPLADVLSLLSNAVDEGRSLSEALERAAALVRQDEPAIAEAEHVAAALDPAAAAVAEPAIAAAEHVAEALDPNNPGGVTYPWLQPAAAPEHAAPAPAPAHDEGGSGTMTVPVTGQTVDASHDDPAPTWDQNVDDNPGGDAIDPAHSNDCGEQCAAMAVYSVRGVELPEELVRKYIKGDSADARTTAADLAGYLSGPHCHINACTDQQPWPHQRATLETQLDAGHLALVLGDWHGVPHWVLATGYDAHALHAHDPWTGGATSYAWADVPGFTQTPDCGGWMVLVKEEARYS